MIGNEVHVAEIATGEVKDTTPPASSSSRAASSEDPEFKAWMEKHRARNGEKLRVSLGATGVCVMFGKEADMAHRETRSYRTAKAKGTTLGGRRVP